MSQLSASRVRIANGTALSNEIDLRRYKLVGIQMPAAWTAANLSFQARPKLTDTSTGNDTPQDVFDQAGAEVSITAVVGHYIAVSDIVASQLAGMAALKIRSGLTGAPVNQGADRELLLVLEARPI